jgi:D-sedoheptulose 7-phosphate isomerase
MSLDSSGFIHDYLKEVSLIADDIDWQSISHAVNILADVRNQKGRLFIIGVGGSAGTASHAINDFRKICGIEAYSPIDNVSELTAFTNDVGWEHTFDYWLLESNICNKDALLVFSVGGGNVEKNLSVNIINAIREANLFGASVIAIVGRDGGYAGERADATILIPTVNQDRITPHTEGFHSIILHLLVSHPFLQKNQTTWESKK